MKTRLIQIGNSRGIRLPKTLIDELGLEDEVELVLRDDELVIRSADSARTGWASAAAALAEDTPGDLLDAPTSTRFDDEEWTWYLPAGPAGATCGWYPSIRPPAARSARPGPAWWCRPTNSTPTLPRSSWHR